MNKKISNILFSGYGLGIAGFITGIFFVLVKSLNPFIIPIFFVFILALILIKRFEDKKTEKSDINKNQKIDRVNSKAWYYESIVNNSKDILFTTDADHRIIKLNKEAEDTFGVQAFEYLGKSVQSLFPNPRKIDKVIQEIQKTSQAEIDELKIFNKITKEEHWISIRISSLKDIDTSGSELARRNKDFIGEIFSCRNITQKKRLQEELKNKNDQLIKLSITDSLTNLYNVRHLKVEARKLQKIHSRYPDRPLSLALIDIDKFKEHNDKFGHLAGDKILILLSDIIQAQIRKDLDGAFRYGGDEFVLLLPETDSEGAQVICERILNNYLNQKVGETSLSIGVAQYQRTWGVLSASLLVNRADEAMYVVKKLGGNGLHTYSAPLSDELKNRSSLNQPAK